MGCKCDMHVCWERIYDWMDHFHRDPVANVVIYSSLCVFLGACSIAIGTALYVIMDQNLSNSNDVIVDAILTWNPCHVIIPIMSGVFLMLVCAVGIAAGEIHIPILYSIFGGTGVAAVFFEIYSFAVSVAQIRRNHDNLNQTELGLAATLCVTHGLSMYFLIMAIRFAWVVNYHFSRQEKMIEAEQIKKEQALSTLDTKLDFTIAKSKVEDDEIQTRGLQKSRLKVHEERAKSQMSIARSMA